MHMTKCSASETVETAVWKQQELMTIKHDNPAPVWIQISDT